MKKISVLFALVILLAGCSKKRITPEGPTDVRIRNLSDQTFSAVTVDTGEGEESYGTIEPGTVSDYIRFEKAFPKAEVNALINGLQYTTGTPDNTYETYIGPDKITYEVFISNDDLHELKISNVVLEGPITDL